MKKKKARTELYFTTNNLILKVKSIEARKSNGDAMYLVYKGSVKSRHSFLGKVYDGPGELTEWGIQNMKELTRTEGRKLYKTFS